MSIIYHYRASAIKNIMTEWFKFVNKHREGGHWKSKNYIPWLNISNA